MSERVILAVKYTPAGSIGQVRKAVGGFLRYVQHRDVHPTQPESKPKREVSGLLKYVAYRDRASWRAELFGPAHALGSGGLRWIAAIHRNTAHHHVHLVLAGMRDDGAGGFQRVDVTKPRLAAMKEALVMEIERQRGERTRLQAPTQLTALAAKTDRNTT